MAPHATLEHRCDQFVQHATNLGCVNPTERTAKRWTAEVLVMNYSDSNLRSLTIEAKVKTMKHLKWLLRKRVRYARKGFEYVLELPSQPEQLLQSHPDLYKSVFRDTLPAKSPLDASLVMIIDESLG